MKKNYSMRIASMLLVLVLLTTCVISGTFAKYTTAGEASDSVRVAKFGVTVVADSSTAILTKEVGNTDEGQVKLDAEKMLVAPGTQINDLADFTITGTPEVAVNVSYVANLVLTGWEAEGYYCPLEITVNGTTYKGTNFATAAAFETEVEEAIANLSDNYAVGENLSGALAPEVSVVWTFEGNDNVKDTVLGNAATAPTLALVITCTITQID